MFKTISASIPTDPDYPDRTRRLTVLSRLLDGTFYDELPYSFQDEKNGAGEYVPLRQRRPAVQYGLAAIVVKDAVGMLFSDGHFPQIRCEDAGTREAVAVILREASLPEKMIEAATRGSVGSVAIRMRILKQRVFFDIFDTRYLTPTWKSDEPDQLAGISERYKVGREILEAMGYQLPQSESVFWFGRDWDDGQEIWYQPWTMADAGKKNFAPVVDDSRTVRHDLGFVPWVWIKNLPGGDDIDGACTFAGAISESIEIDYQLSQLGRGLRYSSDPTLLIKEPSFGEGALVKGASNAIVVEEGGDAKMLEINGTAATAVLEYVRALRELGLEAVGGNRSNADKIAAVQSGRAMELMHHALVLLSDKLRISYGQGGLLALLELVQRAVATGRALVDRKGRPLRIDPLADLRLGWPQWFPPTSHDLLELSQAYQGLRQSLLLSQETGVHLVATDYDLPDAAAELRRIEAEPPPPAAAGPKPDDASGGGNSSTTTDQTDDAL